MRETSRHRSAFEFYYGQGGSRSYVLTAVHIGVSKHSISRWSKSFAWQQRVAARDAKISDEVENRADDNLANFKLKQLRTISSKLTEFAHSDIAANDIADFDRLVKLSLLIRGEATERTETEINYDQLFDSMTHEQKLIWLKNNTT